MHIASPAPTVPSGLVADRRASDDRQLARLAGVAPATSEARTANPSIAEDANSGRSPVATTSSATTHP